MDVFKGLEQLFLEKTQQTSFIFAHEEQVESIELSEAESAIVESDTAF